MLRQKMGEMSSELRERRAVGLEESSVVCYTNTILNSLFPKKSNTKENFNPKKRS